MPHWVKDRTGARMSGKQIELKDCKLDDGGSCDVATYNSVSLRLNPIGAFEPKKLGSGRILGQPEEIQIHKQWWAANFQIARHPTTIADWTLPNLR
jgi:hypothetical protein